MEAGVWNLFPWGDQLSLGYGSPGLSPPEPASRRRRGKRRCAAPGWCSTDQRVTQLMQPALDGDSHLTMASLVGTGKVSSAAAASAAVR